jgi:hypothetical protein
MRCGTLAIGLSRRATVWANPCSRFRECPCGQVFEHARPRGGSEPERRRPSCCKIAGCVGMRSYSAYRICTPTFVLGTYIGEQSKREP